MLFNREIKSTREFFYESKVHCFPFASQCNALTAWDHLRHYPVQHLEIIGPTTKQSDWLILVIGSLAV